MNTEQKTEGREAHAGPDPAPDTQADIRLRSNVIRDIIGYTPPWILRWGITSILGVIALILFLTWFVKYPDTISGTVKITTRTPPISAVAEASGGLELFVSDGQEVKRGALLGLIDNPARFKDIMFLQNELEVFAASLDSSDGMARPAFRKDLMLGELRDPYSRFHQHYVEYRHLTRSDYYEKAIKLLEGQIKEYRALNKAIALQKTLLVKELELAGKQYELKKLSYEKKLISRVELLGAHQAYLIKQREFENANESVIRNTLAADKHQQGIRDLSKKYGETRRQLEENIRESLKQLQSGITAWGKKYALRAPINGYVSFFRYWSDKQYVKTGDEVFILVPGLSGPIGRMVVPAAGAGKIKPGQRVDIKCNDYPFKEFGVLIGRVSAISPVAVEMGAQRDASSQSSGYIVSVELPDGLNTSHKKELGFKQGMTGQASIVTRKYRLIQRFFETIQYVFRREE